MISEKFLNGRICADVGILQPGDLFIDLLLLPVHIVHLFLCDKPYAIPVFTQSEVGIVLAEQQAVFRA